jgi:hypothetical protein
MVGMKWVLKLDVKIVINFLEKFCVLLVIRLIIAKKIISNLEK